MPENMNHDIREYISFTYQLLDWDAQHSGVDDLLLKAGMARQGVHQLLNGQSLTRQGDRTALAQVVGTGPAQLRDLLDRQLSRVATWQLRSALPMKYNGDRAALAAAFTVASGRR